MSFPPLFRPSSGQVTPKNEETTPTNNIFEEDFGNEEYTLPSLPMKFSFNRIYLTKNPNSEELPDLSLKAIFSKNASPAQLKARKAFLLKASAGLAGVLVLIIALVVIIVLVTKTDTKAVEEVQTTTTTTTKAPFTRIDAALINDVIIIDENRVVSSALDGEINVWNSNNGDNLQTWKAHSSPTKLALLDNGQLVTGSLDAIGSIKIWNPNTGALIDVYPTPGTVTSLLTIDATTLASGHQNSEIKLWNTATQTLIRTLSDNNGDVNKLLLLSNNQLASGTTSGNVVIWDQAGTKVREINGLLTNDPVKSLVQVSPTQLAVGSLDGNIRFWNFGAGLLTGARDVGTPVNSMVYISATTLAYGGAVDVGILWFDIQTQFFVTTFNSTVQKTFSGHSATVNSLIFLNDSRLASGSNDGDIRFWNV